MSDKVQACPECESCQTSVSNIGSPRGIATEDAPRWVCDECGHRFNEHIGRDSRGSKNAGGGMRSELLNADPDEWP